RRGLVDAPRPDDPSGQGRVPRAARARVRLARGGRRGVSPGPPPASPARGGIDEAYRRLALLILARKGSVGRLALGTHDVGLIRQIETDVGGRDGFEVHMLFGIRQADLLRMAADGYRARSLISYGTNWYPWFMRRIAEKPVENTMLALRNLV